MLSQKIADIWQIVESLELADKAAIEDLLHKVEPLLLKAAHKGQPDDGDFQSLIQSLVEHPEQAWLIDKLLEKTSAQSQSAQGTSDSTHQGKVQLKMRPEHNDKTLKLKNAIRFFQHRKSLATGLHQLSQKGIFKPKSPKLIAALDSILDLITSFFAEPSVKKKISPFPLKPRPKNFNN